MKDEPSKLEVGPVASTVIDVPSHPEKSRLWKRYRKLIVVFCLWMAGFLYDPEYWFERNLRAFTDAYTWAFERGWSTSGIFAISWIAGILWEYRARWRAIMDPKFLRILLEKARAGLRVPLGLCLIFFLAHLL